MTTADSDPAIAWFAPPSGRGGPQEIPRPPGSRQGTGAPWAHLAPEDLDLSVGAIRKALAGLGPARPSVVEADDRVSAGSAVLAPLYEHDGRTWVILTRRTLALRHHGGQVSFPGGRQEPGETLEDAARREAFEEIGLEPASVEIIGELDHLATITSGSAIVPFVGVLPARPDYLVANPDEVDAIVHVTLDELCDPCVYRSELWPIGGMRPIFFFELEGDTVWGATAAMLRQLLGIVTGTLGRGDIAHH